MNKDKFKKSAIGVAKDIIIAFTIVCIVMLTIYAYCGIWPPMVVVESGSMQRYPDRSVIGVIDTGDMVFVKNVNGIDDIVTYVEGEGSHSKYGNFGDVIIYRPDGMRERTMNNKTQVVIPIIHRAVVWIEANTSKCQNLSGGSFDYANCTFDVPSLEMYGTRDAIVLSDYGHWEDDVTINLESIMRLYQVKGTEPHDGYITKGDNNNGIDQVSYEPVLPEWVVGKAVGELPWFGLIKLKVTGSNLADAPSNSWISLYISISLLLFVPLLFDMLYPRAVKWRRGKKEMAAKEPKTEVAAMPAEDAAKDSGAEPAPEKDVGGESNPEAGDTSRE